jgi:hypothetical protein
MKDLFTLAKSDAISFDNLHSFIDDLMLCDSHDNLYGVDFDLSLNDDKTIILTLTNGKGEKQIYHFDSNDNDEYQILITIDDKTNISRFLLMDSLNNYNRILDFINKGKSKTNKRDNPFTTITKNLPNSEFSQVTKDLPNITSTNLRKCSKCGSEFDLTKAFNRTCLENNCPMGFQTLR